MLESLLNNMKNTSKIFELDFDKYSLGTVNGFADSISGRAITATAASPGSVVDHETLGRSYYFNGTGGFVLEGAAPSISNKSTLITVEAFCEDTAARTIVYTGLFGSQRIPGWSIWSNIPSPYPGDLAWRDNGLEWNRLYKSGNTPKTGHRLLKFFISSQYENAFKTDDSTPITTALAPATSIASGPALYIGVMGPNNTAYPPFKGWIKKVTMIAAKNING